MTAWRNAGWTKVWLSLPQLVWATPSEDSAPKDETARRHRYTCEICHCFLVGKWRALEMTRWPLAEAGGAGKERGHAGSPQHVRATMEGNLKQKAISQLTTASVGHFHQNEYHVRALPTHLPPRHATMARQPHSRGESKPHRKDDNMHIFCSAPKRIGS